MEQEIKVIKINGVDYIPLSDATTTPAKQMDGLNYVIVRTYSAGVFAGYLESKEGQEVVLLNSRRIWKWSGAASLSQMAMEGTSDPENCKFPQAVSMTVLTQAIEIISVTEAAKKSIQGVKVWKQ